jgi:VIT1/CCC1 family predicted Fe2+/Mn2+ transporter
MIPRCLHYTTAMQNVVHAPHTHDPHVEGHFESTEAVRDIVIGLSDGLTVPFALAAGLSGAVASSHIVVLAGLAEIAAGSIAMGLGGYLAARGDAEHYASERQREEREIIERTHDEEEEIYEIFEQYQVDRTSAAPVLTALKQNPAAWVDFMMRFELGLEEPASNRARRSALTIAASYIAGGLIPLLPYMLVESNLSALKLSVVITLLAALAGFAVRSRPSPLVELPQPQPTSSLVCSTRTPTNDQGPERFISPSPNIAQSLRMIRFRSGLRLLGEHWT